MLYQSIVNLLEDVADSLPFDNEFMHGRASDFNIFSGKDKDIYIWLTPMRSNAEFPNQSNRMLLTYNVELGFYNRDKIDGDNNYSLAIVEKMDKAATKYLLDLNNKIITNDSFSDTVTLTGITKEPFIKFKAEILTGVLATFRITLPDDFVYC